MYLVVFRSEGHRSGIDKAKIVGTFVEAKDLAMNYVGEEYTVGIKMDLSPTVYEELRSVNNEDHVVKVATIMMVD